MTPKISTSTWHGYITLVQKEHHNVGIFKEISMWPVNMIWGLSGKSLAWLGKDNTINTKVDVDERLPLITEISHILKNPWRTNQKMYKTSLDDN